MINTCFSCGRYRADKIIDPDGPVAICPECGHSHPFLQLPLLIVSGASGSGKTTIFRQLVGKVSEAVLLDSDLLYRDELYDQESGYNYFEMWLRVCKDISQSGRPVVLFGAGMGVPMNLEQCTERRYFSVVHYLALVCDDRTLADRMRTRAKARARRDEATIAEHVSFNRWFKEHGGDTDPPVELIDTTELSIQETADQVMSWVRRKLGNSPQEEKSR